MVERGNQSYQRWWGQGGGRTGQLKLCDQSPGLLIWAAICSGPTEPPTGKGGKGGDGDGVELLVLVAVEMVIVLVVIVVVVRDEGKGLQWWWVVGRGE